MGGEKHGTRGTYFKGGSLSYLWEFQNDFTYNIIYITYSYTIQYSITKWAHATSIVDFFARKRNDLWQEVVSFKINLLLIMRSSNLNKEDNKEIGL